MAQQTTDESMVVSMGVPQQKPIMIVFTQSHGDEGNQEISRPTARLFTFCGQVGKIGHAMRVKMEDDGNEREIPIDILVLDEIQRIFAGYHEKNTQKEKQKLLSFLNHKLSRRLKHTYEGQGIYYTTNLGLKTIIPRFNKTFYFEKNPHEDCISCYGDPQGKQCSKELPHDVPLCPEYGLSVVDVFNPPDPRDSQYSLAALPQNTDGRQRANWSLNQETQQYWRQRLEGNPGALTIFDNMIAEKKIKYTQLVDIASALGYELIVIDPSCRSIKKKIGNFNRFARTYRERMKLEPRSRLNLGEIFRYKIANEIGVPKEAIKIMKVEKPHPEHYKVVYIDPTDMKFKNKVFHRKTPAKMPGTAGGRRTKHAQNKKHKNKTLKRHPKKTRKKRLRMMW